MTIEQKWKEKRSVGEDGKQTEKERGSVIERKLLRQRKKKMKRMGPRKNAGAMIKA